MVWFLLNNFTQCLRLKRTTFYTPPSPWPFSRLNQSNKSSSVRPLTSKGSIGSQKECYHLYKTQKTSSELPRYGFSNEFPKVVEKSYYFSKLPYGLKGNSQRYLSRWFIGPRRRARFLRLYESCMYILREIAVDICNLKKPILFIVLPRKNITWRLLRSYK